MTAAVIRPARLAEVPRIVDLYADVAAEGRWIGRELPLDIEATRERFSASIDAADHYATVAELTGADADGTPYPFDGLVGYLHLGVAPYGVAELGMHIAAVARGQGIGQALLADAVTWARAEPTVHKIALQVWPHNERAQNLYRRAGFVSEGYLHQHYRRRNGELWDAVVMGLVL